MTPPPPARRSTGRQVAMMMLLGLLGSLVATAGLVALIVTYGGALRPAGAQTAPGVRAAEQPPGTANPAPAASTPASNPTTSITLAAAPPTPSLSTPAPPRPARVTATQVTPTAVVPAPVAVAPVAVAPVAVAQVAPMPAMPTLVTPGRSAAASVLSAVPAATSAVPAMPTVQTPTALVSRSMPIAWVRQTSARRAQDGHYYFDTALNGASASIRMMFDTGATSVALRAEDAAQAGIDVSSLDYSIISHTANGTTTVAPVRLDSLQVGGITHRNVRATVSRPGRLGVSLLGQSFMSKLAGYRFEKDELVLQGE